MRDLPRFSDPDLLVGPETMDDAGVYRLGDGLAIVQTIDFFPPVVDDPYVFGQIAAANALSDIYAMGGRPRTALNLVGFPDDQLPLDLLGAILRGGGERVQAAGAVILGGHSVRDAEIKYGLAVTGTIDPGRVRTNATARGGDVLVLTKGLGTGFVTTAHKAGRCPEPTLRAACASMVQLNDSAAEEMLAAGAHAATDVTGFGLAGHGYEMARASRLCLELDAGRLPVLPGAADLVRAGYFTRASASNRRFVEPALRVEPGVDPTLLEFVFDAQTSGGLLISMPPDRAAGLVERLRARGLALARSIGRVVECRDGVAVRVRP